MQVATESYAATAAGVRAAIAAYAQAVDDGRRGDIAALFCADGWVDLPSAGVVVGRKALDALFRGEKPPSESRHIVTSTHITRWGADHAVAISDLVIVETGSLGPSGRWAAISTCCTAGTAAGSFTREPCVSSMTPERWATPPTAASNHRKAP
jgi:hypothetical protein